MATGSSPTPVETPGVKSITLKTPWGILLKQSRVFDGLGAWSSLPIVNGGIFGPLASDVGSEQNVVAIDFHSTSEVYDAQTQELLQAESSTDGVKSSWMQYIRRARFFEEQNMVSTRVGSQVFYKAIKDISPDEELLTFFGHAEVKNKPNKMDEKSPEKIQKKRGRPRKSERNVNSLYARRSQSVEKQETITMKFKKVKKERSVKSQSSKNSTSRSTLPPVKKVCIDKKDPNVANSCQWSLSPVEDSENSFTEMPSTEVKRRNSIVGQDDDEEFFYYFETRPCHVVENKGTKLFECDVCKGVYRYAFSLKRHFLRNHINYKYLSEADISNCMINVAQQDMVAKRHASGKRPKNNATLLSSVPRASMKPNFVSSCMHQLELYRCSLCSELFDYMEDLVEHTHNHMTAPPTVAPMAPVKAQLACGICRMNFTYKQNLIRHQAVHSGERPFKCEYCLRTFPTQISRKQHIRIHVHNKNKNKDSNSNNTTSTTTTTTTTNSNSSNNTNSSSSNSNKPVAALAPKPVVKVEPEPTVPTEEDLKCQICGKIFSCTSFLNKHIVCMHNGAMKRKASQNRKAANSQKDTTSQIIKTEPDTENQPDASTESVAPKLPKQTKKKSKFKYICTVCKRKFRSYIQMCKHRRIVHSKVLITNKNAVFYDLEQSCFENELLPGDMEAPYLEPKDVAENVAHNLLCFIDGRVDSLSDFAKHVKIKGYTSVHEHDPEYSKPSNMIWSQYNFPVSFRIPSDERISSDGVGDAYLSENSTTFSDGPSLKIFDTKQNQQPCHSTLSDPDASMNFSVKSEPTILDDDDNTVKSPCTDPSSLTFASPVGFASSLTSKTDSTVKNDFMSFCGLSLVNKTLDSLESNLCSQLQDGVAGESAKKFCDISGNSPTAVGLVPVTNTDFQTVTCGIIDSRVPTDCTSPHSMSLMPSSVTIPKSLSISCASIKSETLLSLSEDNVHTRRNITSSEGNVTEADNSPVHTAVPTTQNSNEPILNSSQKQVRFQSASIVHEYPTTPDCLPGTIVKNVPDLTSKLENVSVALPTITSTTSVDCLPAVLSGNNRPSLPSTSQDAAANAVLQQFQQSSSSCDINLSSISAKPIEEDKKVSQPTTAAVENPTATSNKILKCGQKDILFSGPHMMTAHIHERGHMVLEFGNEKEISSKIKNSSNVRIEEPQKPFSLKIPGFVKKSKKNQNLLDFSIQHIVKTRVQDYKQYITKNEIWSESEQNAARILENSENKDLCLVNYPRYDIPARLEKYINKNGSDNIKISAFIKSGLLPSENLKDLENSFRGICFESWERTVVDYNKFAFGKQGIVNFVCSVCHKHFLDVDTLLRHQQHKHPSIECGFLEVELGQYIVFLHFPIPELDGILCRANIDLSACKNLERYSCSKCQYSFPTVARLHSHMVRCASNFENVLTINNSAIGKRKYKKRLKKRLRDVLNGSNTFKFRLKDFAGYDPTLFRENHVGRPRFRGCRNRKIVSLHEESEKTNKRRNNDLLYNPKNHVRRRESVEVIETHQCRGCNVKFKSLSLLERHAPNCIRKDKLQNLKVLEGTTSTTRRIRPLHRCHYCNKQFTYPKSLCNHYRNFCSLRKQHMLSGFLQKDHLHQQEAVMASLVQQEEKGTPTLETQTSAIDSPSDGDQNSNASRKGWPKGLKRKFRRKNHSWTYIKKKKLKDSDKPDEEDGDNQSSVSQAEDSKDGILDGDTNDEDSNVNFNVSENEMPKSSGEALQELLVTAKPLMGIKSEKESLDNYPSIQNVSLDKKKDLFPATVKPLKNCTLYKLQMSTEPIVSKCKNISETELYKQLTKNNISVGMEVVQFPFCSNLEKTEVTVPLKPTPKPKEITRLLESKSKCFTFGNQLHGISLKTEQQSFVGDKKIPNEALSDISQLCLSYGTPSTTTKEADVITNDQSHQLLETHQGTLRNFESENSNSQISHLTREDIAMEGNEQAVQFLPVKQDFEHKSNNKEQKFSPINQSVENTQDCLTHSVVLETCSESKLESVDSTSENISNYYNVLLPSAETINSTSVELCRLATDDNLIYVNVLKMEPESVAQSCSVDRVSAISKSPVLNHSPNVAGSLSVVDHLDFKLGKPSLVSVEGNTNVKAPIEPTIPEGSTSSANLQHVTRIFTNNSLKNNNCDNEQLGTGDSSLQICKDGFRGILLSTKGREMSEQFESTVDKSCLSKAVADGVSGEVVVDCVSEEAVVDCVSEEAVVDCVSEVAVDGRVSSAAMGSCVTSEAMGGCVMPEAVGVCMLDKAVGDYMSGEDVGGWESVKAVGGCVMGETLPSCVSDKGMSSCAPSEVVQSCVSGECVDGYMQGDAYVINEKNTNTVICCTDKTIINNTIVKCETDEILENKATVEYVADETVVNKASLEYVPDETVVNKATVEYMADETVVNKSTVEYVADEIVENKATVEYMADETVVNKATLEYVADEIVENMATVEYMADETVEHKVTVEYLADETVVNKATVEYVADEIVENKATVEYMADETVVNKASVEYVADEIVENMATVEYVADETVVNKTTVEYLAETVVNKATVECVSDEIVENNTTVEYMADETVDINAAVKYVADETLVNKAAVEYVANEIVENMATVEYVADETVENKATVKYLADEVLPNQIIDNIEIRSISNEIAGNFCANRDIPREGIIDCVMNEDVLGWDVVIEATVDCLPNKTFVANETVVDVVTSEEAAIDCVLSETCVGNEATNEGVLSKISVPNGVVFACKEPVALISNSSVHKIEQSVTLTNNVVGEDVMEEVCETSRVAFRKPRIVFTPPVDFCKVAKTTVESTVSSGLQNTPGFAYQRMLTRLPIEDCLAKPTTDVGMNRETSVHQVATTSSNSAKCEAVSEQLQNVGNRMLNVQPFLEGKLGVYNVCEDQDPLLLLSKVATAEATSLRTVMNSSLWTFERNSLQTVMDSSLQTFERNSLQTVVDSNLQTFERNNLETVVDSSLRTFERNSLSVVDSNLQTVGKSSLQTVEDSSIQTVEKNSLWTVKDSSLRIVEDSSQRTVEDSNLRTVEDSNLRTVEDISLQTVEDISLRTVEDSSLRTVEDSSLRTVDDSSLRTVDDSSLRTVDNSSLQNVEDTNLLTIEGSSLRTIEENASSENDFTALTSLNFESELELEVVPEAIMEGDILYEDFPSSVSVSAITHDSMSLETPPDCRKSVRQSSLDMPSTAEKSKKPLSPALPTPVPIVDLLHYGSSINDRGNYIVCFIPDPQVNKTPSGGLVQKNECRCLSGGELSKQPDSFKSIDSRLNHKCNKPNLQTAVEDSLFRHHTPELNQLLPINNNNTKQQIYKLPH